MLVAILVFDKVDKENYQIETHSNKGLIHQDPAITNV